MKESTDMTIKCPQCGCTKFEQPDNIKSSDFVKCGGCNFEITYADLIECATEQAKEEVMPDVKKEVERMIKKLLRGLSK